MTRKDKSQKEHISAEKINPHFRIEADGKFKNLSLSISGCVSISEFSEEKIVVFTRREEITFNGKKLKITLFEDKTVEIIGKIDSLFFELRERKRGV